MKNWLFIWVVKVWVVKVGRVINITQKSLWEQ